MKVGKSFLIHVLWVEPSPFISLHSYFFRSEDFATEENPAGFETEIDVTETNSIETATAVPDLDLSLADSSDQIKPENIEKVRLNTFLIYLSNYRHCQCDKCLRSTFRYRHAGFCSKEGSHFIYINTSTEMMITSVGQTIDYVYQMTPRQVCEE